jgi:hypothetical protein
MADYKTGWYLDLPRLFLVHEFENPLEIDTDV